MQDDVAGMSVLYENTVRTLNGRLDDLLAESGLEGIDKTKRALTDAYDEQQLAWMNESEKARTVGVTEDGADFSVTVRRQGETDDTYVRASPLPYFAVAGQSLDGPAPLRHRATPGRNGAGPCRPKRAEGCGDGR